MTPKQILVNALQAAWDDPFESLQSAIVGLTDDEAAWQPPSCASEPHDQGVGAPGTVLWYLNHLAHCHHHYIEVLTTLDPENPPDTPAPGERPLAETLDTLTSATHDLIATVEALTDDALDRHVRPNRNVADFVLMTSRHLTWHSAQIRTTRRLYANRDA